MSEQEFWQSTPRKLFALYEIYLKINGAGEETKNSKKEAPKGYIDELF